MRSLHPMEERAKPSRHRGRRLAVAKASLPRLLLARVLRVERKHTAVNARITVCEVQRSSSRRTEGHIHYDVLVAGRRPPFAPS